MWHVNADDCLIEVTAWAGLIVFKYVKQFNFITLIWTSIYDQISNVCFSCICWLFFKLYYLSMNLVVESSYFWIIICNGISVFQLVGYTGSNTGKRARRKNLRHPRERFLVSNEAPHHICELPFVTEYQCFN